MTTDWGDCVRGVVVAARRVASNPIAVVDRPRRPGGPLELVAPPEAIMHGLMWRLRHRDIEAIPALARRWHSQYP